MRHPGPTREGGFGKPADSRGRQALSRRCRRECAPASVGALAHSARHETQPPRPRHEGRHPWHSQVPVHSARRGACCPRHRRDAACVIAPPSAFRSGSGAASSAATLRSTAVVDSARTAALSARWRSRYGNDTASCSVSDRPEFESGFGFDAPRKSVCREAPSRTVDHLRAASGASVVRSVRRSGGGMRRSPLDRAIASPQNVVFETPAVAWRTASVTPTSYDVPPSSNATTSPWQG